VNPRNRFGGQAIVVRDEEVDARLSRARSWMASGGRIKRSRRISA